MTGRFFALEAICPGCGAIRGSNKGRCRCRDKKIRWTLVAANEPYPVVKNIPGGARLTGIPVTILRPGF